MTSANSRTVVVGAGPYGLSVAAHLCAAGVETRVFGQPLEYWRSQMPRGMLLRSSWEATHIADPEHRLTLDAFQSATGVHVPNPIPVERFVEYGMWFQRAVAPDVDRRSVTAVEPAESGFRVQLDDGEWIRANRVIVATGLAGFARRPAVASGLPPSLVSHTSEHRDLGEFAGRSVLVLGGGQSALESAALLRESGAEVEVVVRAPRVHWLGRSLWLHTQTGPLKRLLYPPTDVGPPGLNWIVAMPNLFRRLPLSLQVPIAARSIRPAGAGWLVPRLEGVPITTGRTVVSAAPDGDRLTVTLDDGSTRSVDHLLLATGYQIDVNGYAFLPAEIRRIVRGPDGYPALGRGFESRVPGLHFIGAAAATSFGPVMRFVSGTTFTGAEITRHVLGTRAQPQHVTDARLADRRRAMLGSSRDK